MGTPYSIEAKQPVLRVGIQATPRTCGLVVNFVGLSINSSSQHSLCGYTDCVKSRVRSSQGQDTHNVPGQELM